MWISSHSLRVNIQLGRGHCSAYGLRSSAQYLVAFVPNEFVVPAEARTQELQALALVDAWGRHWAPAFREGDE